MLNVLYGSCVENDKYLEDKLLLVTFCFGFIAAFRFVQTSELSSYAPLVIHAMNTLQTKETEELFNIAATAAIIACASGIMDQGIVVQLCNNEVTEV